MKEFKKCSILKEENSTHSDKTINEQVENYYSQRPDLARKEIADLENTIVELKNANRELAEYNADLKSQLVDTEKRLDKELNINFEKYDNQILKLMTKNKVLEKQLANIKYLNTDEVEHIIGSINTNQEKVQAICNLAIDIDRDKIIAILVGKILESEKDAIRIANEIIKAIRGEE